MVWVGIQNGPSLGGQDQYGKSELRSHAQLCFGSLNVYAHRILLVKNNTQSSGPLPHHQKLQQMPHWHYFKGNLNENDVHVNSTNHH